MLHICWYGSEKLPQIIVYNNININNNPIINKTTSTAARWILKQLLWYEANSTYGNICAISQQILLSYQKLQVDSKQYYDAIINFILTILTEKKPKKIYNIVNKYFQSNQNREKFLEQIALLQPETMQTIQNAFWENIKHELQEHINHIQNTTQLKQYVVKYLQYIPDIGLNFNETTHANLMNATGM